jgi:hypothetical protein
MRPPSYKQLLAHENNWIALRKKDQKVVGSGPNVSAAKKDAEHHGYNDVIFLKVYPSNMGFLPVVHEV